MKVRAISQGFYLGRHIDAGTVFDADPDLYAGKDDPDPKKAPFGWMEKVIEAPPVPAPQATQPAPEKPVVPEVPAAPEAPAIESSSDNGETQ